MTDEDYQHLLRIAKDGLKYREVAEDIQAWRTTHMTAEEQGMEVLDDILDRLKEISNG